MAAAEEQGRNSQGKGGKQKRCPAQHTWLVLIPSPTRWQRGAQRRGCAGTWGVEQLKHASFTTAESLTNHPRLSSLRTVQAVSTRRRLARPCSWASITPLCCRGSLTHFLLVKIKVFVIDTLFFPYITKFQVTIHAPQKHN